MRVSQNLIFIPVMVQVVLTFAVLITMAIARRRTLSEKDVSLKDVSLVSDDFWHDWARQCSNNYKNQFELPVLFYAVCAFALITRQVDSVFLGLALLFVLTRLVHAIVHLTHNDIMWRGTSFLVGFVLLVAMWVMLFVRIAAAGF